MNSKICLVALLALVGLSGCGKAEFSGNSDSSPQTDLPIVTTSDVYIELGQQFSNQISGKVDLTDVELRGDVVWPGQGSLQLEIRASLTGDSAIGTVTPSATPPPGWATATPVVNLTVPANSVDYFLSSANLKSTVAPILEQGQFWIFGRIRYTGLDLGHNLTLKSIYVHAEGQKSLKTLSSLINLGF